MTIHSNQAAATAATTRVTGRLWRGTPMSPATTTSTIEPAKAA
ncbi:hypothetical protein [Actinoplanes sp. ATCC 53533]|nr:hypothetical protein [Actinoplanes sp. ATCC 53533]